VHLRFSATHLVIPIPPPAQPRSRIFLVRWIREHPYRVMAGVFPTAFALVALGNVPYVVQRKWLGILVFFGMVGLMAVFYASVFAARRLRRARYERPIVPLPPPRAIMRFDGTLVPLDPDPTPQPPSRGALPPEAPRDPASPHEA
jgi:hypothetical protein